MNVFGRHSSAWGASLATRLAGPAIARWGCEGGARRSGEWGLLRHAELSHFHRNLSNATRRDARGVSLFPISSFSAGPQGKDGQASTVEAWEDGGANSPRSLEQQQGLQGVTDFGERGYGGKWRGRKRDCLSKRSE
jgi:hypothetical protein